LLKEILEKDNCLIISLKDLREIVGSERSIDAEAKETEHYRVIATRRDLDIIILIEQLISRGE